MRAHILDGNVIANSIEVESLDFKPGLIAAQGSEGVGWVYENGTFSPPVPVPETEEQRRNRLKRERTQAVENITVTTTAGNVFDGDETSQTRMDRGILILQVAYQKAVAEAVAALPPGSTAEEIEAAKQAVSEPTVNWVLHDNTVIQATVAELSEALALAGAAQAAIWVIT